MLLKHVHTAKIQYLANLCLKINAKLGGRNAVPRDKLPFVQDVSLYVGLGKMKEPIYCTEPTRWRVLAMDLWSDFFCFRTPMKLPCKTKAMQYCCRTCGRFICSEKSVVRRVPLVIAGHNYLAHPRPLERKN